VSTKAGRIPILAVLTAAMLVTAAAASAATVRVSGTQTIVNEAAGSYQMHGTLVGNWQVTSLVPQMKAGMALAATGREFFAGCIDTSRNGSCEASEPTGRINFTYLFYGTFDPKTKTEVSGQCLHPITGGTASFANAAGIIHMTDTLVGKTLRTTYTGTLSYGTARAERVTSSANEVTPGVSPC